MSLAENTLGIVLAHGKVADVCRRHEPVWRKNCNELFYFTPTDDPFAPNGDKLGLARQYSVGRSKAYSSDTNVRAREALRFASLTYYEYVLLIEYDSLIFGPIPEKYVPPTDGVSAPVFHNADPKFRGKFYTHFPQMFTRTAVQAVVAAMTALPDGAEHGFTDRYVGLAIENAKVPVLDLNPTGFVCTHNEIDEKKLPDVLAQYKKGARWSHGVKTEKIFKALQKASFE
jgi:hypothetical protein